MPTRRIPIFYASSLDLASNTATISGQEAHHAQKVLRLRVGAQVKVIRNGSTWSGRLVQAGPGSQVIVSLEEGCEAAPWSAPEVGLLVAIPKGRVSDYIAQKATELGVSQLIFFESERAIPRISQTRRRAREERWERLAREAGKQCGRPRLPQIAGPVAFDEVLQIVPRFALPLLLDPDGRPAKEVLAKRRARSAAVIVGPEGGFTEREYRALAEAGARSCRICDAVLRTETAAICAVAVVANSLTCVRSPEPGG